MKNTKKILSMIIVLACMLLLTIPAYAATEAIGEMQSNKSSTDDMDACIDTTKIKLEFVSPEEMDRILAEMENDLANMEAGISPQNWFTDVVYVSAKRVQKGDGTEFCRVAIANRGFIFDRVDVDGEIWLYDMNSRVVGHRNVDEPKISVLHHREFEIYPIGGHYATGAYRLRLSDGDAGTVYSGPLSDFEG